MPIEAAQRAPTAPIRPALSLPFDYERLVGASSWIFVFCGAIAIVEPSPYDFASFVAIPVWFLGGFKIHRFALTFLAILFAYDLSGFIALLPYLDEHDPTLFMVQGLYLALTAVFFTLFFAEKTLRRGELCLNAYAWSTVVAAAAGIAGYFNIAHAGDLFSMYGRASGTFKDPNVLGSYIVMGALYFMQQVLLNRTRWPLIALLALLIDVGGVFLSFSRGSWGAFLVASTMMVGFTFMANPSPRLRRRIVIMVALAAALAAIGLVILLSISSIREFFLQRASGLQDYDEGETGRFGNQLHSLPLLLNSFFGFGPLRFRLTFGLDPHNSYINSFASYGWLGGASFFLMVGLTMFVGFRLAFARSPYQHLAHVFWPSLFVFLVQGFQIDIDHWRHVFLMLGAVWGIETARIRWLSQSGWAVKQAPGGRPRAGAAPA